MSALMGSQTLGRMDTHRIWWKRKLPTISDPVDCTIIGNILLNGSIGDGVSFGDVHTSRADIIASNETSLTENACDPVAFAENSRLIVRSNPGKQL